jgi:mannosyl-3-phosphoglycerate phosphatase family protein
MGMVIVTDLDGTLLDPVTYAIDPALHALDRVKRLGIPLVLCSSKTRAEIERIRRRIGISDPFIPENGGAVVVPTGYFGRLPPGALVADQRITFKLGRPYAAVVASLKEVAAAERVTVIGFSDMTVSEVAADCGLSLLDAQLAKMRQYDEPFKLVGADPAQRSRFLKALKRRGVRVVSGGRYDHATGDTDKGHAVALLRTLFAERGDPVVLAGLGDGLNDVSLLRAVDHPVIVCNDMCGATARLARKVAGATVTSASGPEGWAEAVTALLDRWQSDHAPMPTASPRMRV